MNGRRVKALRRKAEKMTVGNAAVMYEAEDHQKHFRYEGKVHSYIQRTVRLNPRCTRHVYKKLKRGAA